MPLQDRIGYLQAETSPQVLLARLATSRPQHRSGRRLRHGRPPRQPTHRTVRHTQRCRVNPGRRVGQGDAPPC